MFMKRVFFLPVLVLFVALDFSAQMYVYPDDVYYEKGDENILKIIVEDPEVRDATETGIIYAAEEDSVLYLDELTDSIAFHNFFSERVPLLQKSFSKKILLQKDFAFSGETKLFLKPKSYWL